MDVFFTGLVTLLIVTAIFYIVLLGFVFYWHLKKTTFIVVPVIFTFELFVGAFIIASPWFFGFSDIALARWGNVICGLILVLINIWAIYGVAPALDPAEVSPITKIARVRKLKNNKS